MISSDALDHWQSVVPWTRLKEVEQDLVLARLIVEIARHPLLGEGLALKGGTCLHKLWMGRPWRYSEDLDYNLRLTGPRSGILEALDEVGRSVGFGDLQAAYKSEFLHVFFLGVFRDGSPMRVKVDVQLPIEEPAQTHASRPFEVDNPWFTASLEVPSFVPAEMIASKVVALYQRRKHRDLFDMWAALHSGLVTPSEVAAMFAAYRPKQWTPRLAAKNLIKKLERRDYVEPLAISAVHAPAIYDLVANVRMAADLIDTCAKATQPVKRWRRAVTSGGTATIILGDWTNTYQEQQDQGQNKRQVVGLRPAPARHTLKEQIRAAGRADPKASRAQIAQQTGASRSYVSQVLRRIGPAGQK